MKRGKNVPVRSSGITVRSSGITNSAQGRAATSRTAHRTFRGLTNLSLEHVSCHPAAILFPRATHARLRCPASLIDYILCPNLPSKVTRSASAPAFPIMVRDWALWKTPARASGAPGAWMDFEADSTRHSGWAATPPYLRWRLHGRPEAQLLPCGQWQGRAGPTRTLWPTTHTTLMAITDYIRPSVSRSAARRLLRNREPAACNQS